MNNMFDSWYGGKVSRREQLQAKMRNIQTTGSVIAELDAAVSSRTPADQVESIAAFNKERKWQVIQNEKSAPYVGERY